MSKCVTPPISGDSENWPKCVKTGLGDAFFASGETCKWHFPGCFCGEVEKIGSRGNASKDLRWCIVKAGLKWMVFNITFQFVWKWILFIMVIFCAAKKSHLVTPRTNLNYNRNWYPIKEAHANTSQTPSHCGTLVGEHLNRLWRTYDTIPIPIETRALTFYSRKPHIPHDMLQKWLKWKPFEQLRIRWCKDRFSVSTGNTQSCNYKKCGDAVSK